MRKGLLGLVAASLAATGCAVSGTPTLDHSQPPLMVLPTDSPYVQVTAGSVSGLVPSGWHAEPIGLDEPSEGFMASPRPVAWRGASGAPAHVVAGMAATWVDSTEIGVPSDFYYLAARGPLMARLLRSEDCQVRRDRILVDREPAFAHGAPGSPGDFVATGEGVCVRRGTPSTRWSYFIAAPGYGPAQEVGIPGSGLYMVVAVTRDSPRATDRLGHMLSSVRFGEDNIEDFVRALRVNPII